MPMVKSVYAMIQSGEILVNNRSPLIVRFWSGVDKEGPVHPICGQCWMWTKHKFGSGYGRIMVNRKLWRSHRCSWLLHRGKIPEELNVLHHCDVRLCVNPDHLFLGTDWDNSEDRSAKNRQARRDMHGMAKLTQQQVDDIRAEYVFNSRIHGAAAIARKLGMAHSVIHGIVSGKAWKPDRIEVEPVFGSVTGT